MSEEALKIAVKRRDNKGKRETYTHLNAEFQRIAWRDKKDFLSEISPAQKDKYDLISLVYDT